MRPFGVKFLAQVIKPLLLVAGRRRRRRGGVLLQRQMKAFVPAILLRMPRIDALHLDPELPPPHVTAAQRRSSRTASHCRSAARVAARTRGTSARTTGARRARSARQSDN